ncbi:IS4 family transposase [Paraburkholderia azotifigens]|uniref:IS4 family transposase n=1 Tax=Paraburkholderia azotifigens TaxID=2057004 RepID=A0A5C6VTK0_9BURK|nr:IS4 family transposase [Paraburkholderia azotifigens]TXC88270.1 IS4 family transposase [Paraburkholderia azotifigens]
MFDPALADRVRRSPTAFTRNRTLTLPRMAALMMPGMCASVQAELDALFGALDKRGGQTRAVSAQAFSKARRGLSADLFDLARAHLISLAQPHIESMRWNGLRLVAADGSRLRVSTRRGHELRADHYVFALFLPGPELTLHAALHSADGAERQMLFEALDVLQPCTDLLLLDRGFIGNAMVATLTQREIAFCMRVDTHNWKCVTDFTRSGEAERIVTLQAPCEQDARDYELARTPSTVRLIRDLTPSGRVRVLMTSLLDGQRYPAASFGALYHQRWRVEEAFKRLKHRLRLEAVTGLDYLALQQDLGAKILADNLCTLLSDLDVSHDNVCASRPNRVYARGVLKPILGACLLRVRHCLEGLATLLALIHQNRCRIQPARSYPRPPGKTKPHCHLTYKFA